MDPRSGGNLYNVRDIKNDVELCFYDILSFEHICQHVIDKDIIFNCAASTSHPFSMREPWIDLDVNSRGVINILEAIRRFNAYVKFIHLGTSTQLGRLHYQPADENHPEFPTDIYSANKSVSEKFVLIYANAYKMRAAVVRLSNVFGPRATIHSPEFTFNNYFIGLALQGKDITVYGKGNQKRNVVFIDDAVSALIMISQNDDVDGQTWFAVGDEHYSVAEIAEATIKYIGTGQVRFIEWPKGKKAIDVGDAILSNGKIKSILPWTPQDNLKSGLIKTRDYYRSCLDEYLR
jgi:UDP-glucose 4-epimerase